MWPPEGRPTSVRSRSEKLKHVGGVPAYSAVTIMYTTLKMLRCKGKVQNRVAPAARSKRGQRSNSCSQTSGTQHVDLCDRSAGSLELKGHPWLLVLSRLFVALVFVIAQGNKEIGIYLF